MIHFPLVKRQACKHSFNAVWLQVTTDSYGSMIHALSGTVLHAIAFARSD